MQNEVSNCRVDFGIEAVKMIERIVSPLTGRKSLGQLFRPATSAGAN